MMRGRVGYRGEGGDVDGVRRGRVMVRGWGSE